MSKTILRLAALAAAAAGLALLLMSPGMGEAAGQAILAQHGGSMDTTAYLAQMESAVVSYRIIGGILLGAGLLRALQA